MRIYRTTQQAEGHLKAPAVAIGNFDGVHLGHQALFGRARALAHTRGGDAVALTFSPHPARYFNPKLAPPLVTHEDKKLELMETCGLDAVVIMPFNAELANLSPAEFVQKVLVRQLNTKDVVVGQDFVFGSDRTGNMETLRTLGEQHGFSAHGIQPICVSAIRVSSSKLREFLLLGKVGGASMLLGRDYRVDGIVVPGKARGRTIGVPTANIAPENEIIPRKGVYAGWVNIPGDQEIHQAVINIGTNPTFEKAAVFSLEVHILDYTGDLYDKRLGVYFTQRLRDEQRFPSVEKLLEAIRNDISDARALLRTPALTISLQ